MVKPLAYYKCMGNFYSLITSLSVHQMTVLKHNCAGFKGLPNGANFIVIDHCVGELLSINKVSSERERTIIQFRIIDQVAIWK